MKKIIIDCDPGIDDALALMLALRSPELDVAGITVVCGNVPAPLGAQNTLKVLKLMNRTDIPVYLGATAPLVRPLVTAQDTHGMDGLGESGYPEVTDLPIHENAVDFIIESLHNIDDLSIIALGPMTNIALALKKDPQVFSRLSQLTAMGGSYKSHGNCSPVAEFNDWADPHAAKYVFEHLGRPITMVGLDVTRKIVLTPNLISLLGHFRDEVSQFIIDITKFYVNFHWEQEKILGCVINDPLAVACFIAPELCSGFDAYVTVETEGLCMGQSIVDAMDFWRKPHNAQVLTQVDEGAFMKMFLERLFPEHAGLIAHYVKGGDRA